MLHLAKTFGVQRFVETGTYHGDTAEWASENFQTVYTIEKSRVLYDAAQEKLAELSNVQCLYGDSRAQLPITVSGAASSAIFWLDGHWCGGESYGEDDQCPLMKEIDVLNSVPVQHVLFIDDARLFTSPPPLPNRITEWPTIVEVCSALDSGPYRRYIVIFEDVIIAVPHQMRDTLAEWCQAANTKAWNEYGQQVSQKKLKRYIRQARIEMRQLARANIERLRAAMFNEKRGE
jgi:hypothetical protein